MGYTNVSKKKADQEGSNLQKTNKVKSCIMNTTYLQIPCSSGQKKSMRNASNLQYYGKNTNIICINNKIEQKINNLKIYANKKKNLEEQLDQRLLSRYRSHENEGKLRSNYGEKSRLKI